MFRRLIASMVLAGAVLGAGCAARTPAPPAGQAQPGQVQQAGAASRAEVRATLAARRQLMIERLHAYAQAGVFPLQRLEPNDKVNVFIDDEGRLCAMANLMALDGQRDLVELTARTNNTLRLIDVTRGPLLAWMLESGLTQEEIAMIQEPYYFDDRTSAFRERERQRLQAHFAEVEAQLVRDSEASLDLAVDRLLAAQAAQGA
jgi:hypothetical protein